MLSRRLKLRDNPFPEGRPATLDDLTFLPANLSRLVIDPYREACSVNTDIAGKLDLAQPFLIAGFDDAPEEVRRSVAKGCKDSNSTYLGTRPIGQSVPWWQLLLPPDSQPNADAVALVVSLGHEFSRPELARFYPQQLLGIAISSPSILEDAILYAFEQQFDMILLDGTGHLGMGWPELNGAPNLAILRDAIAIVRRLKREEDIDFVYFGGVRSGTDGAKLISLGAKAVVLGVPIGLAVGGQITDEQSLQFAPDHTDEERHQGVVNIVKASIGEASMMARCTGKTQLHNLEPEDLRAITLATSTATGIPLAGTRPP